uniref:Uncharacterized protein n=1 Tax=Ditylenchus dipsaci TaxID=166011 RepID=A0A915DGJ0_9BILA
MKRAALIVHAPSISKKLAILKSQFQPDTADSFHSRQWLGSPGIEIIEPVVPDTTAQVKNVQATIDGAEVDVEEDEEEVELMLTDEITVLNCSGGENMEGDSEEIPATHQIDSAPMEMECNATRNSNHPPDFQFKKGQSAAPPKSMFGGGSEGINLSAKIPEEDAAAKLANFIRKNFPLPPNAVVTPAAGSDAAGQNWSSKDGGIPSPMLKGNGGRSERQRVVNARSTCNKQQQHELILLDDSESEPENQKHASKPSTRSRAFNSSPTTKTASKKMDKTSKSRKAIIQLEWWLELTMGPGPIFQSPIPPNYTTAVGDTIELTNQFHPQHTLATSQPTQGRPIPVVGNRSSSRPVPVPFVNGEKQVNFFNHKTHCGHASEKNRHFTWRPPPANEIQPRNPERPVFTTLVQEGAQRNRRATSVVTSVTRIYQCEQGQPTSQVLRAEHRQEERSISPNARRARAKSMAGDGGRCENAGSKSKNYEMIRASIHQSRTKILQKNTQSNGFYFNNSRSKSCAPNQDLRRPISPVRYPNGSLVLCSAVTMRNRQDWSASKALAIGEIESDGRQRKRSESSSDSTMTYTLSSSSSTSSSEERRSKRKVKKQLSQVLYSLTEKLANKKSSSKSDDRREASRSVAERDSNSRSSNEANQRRVPSAYNELSIYQPPANSSAFDSSRKRSNHKDDESPKKDVATLPPRPPQTLAPNAKSPVVGARSLIKARVNGARETIERRF